MNKPLNFLSWIGVLCLPLSAWASDLPVPRAENMAELLRESQQLIAQNRAADAFNLLAAQEEHFAGEGEFDYWFGLSARHAGEVARAMFPLERVVAQNPKHAAARMELLAAYMAQQMNDAAEQEITEIEKLEPPPKAQEVLTTYKQVLQERKAASKFKKRIYNLGIDIGHDSNVSAYPDTVLRLPTAIPLSLQLSPSSSNFVALRGLAWRRFDFSNSDWASVSLSGFARQNEKARAYDLGFVQMAGDYTHHLGERHYLRTSLEHSELWLDGSHYRQHQGIALKHQYPLAENWELASELGWRRFDFDQSVNNYHNPWAALTLAFQPKGKPFQASAHLEWDKELETNQRLQGDSERWRFGLSGIYHLSQEHKFSVFARYAQVDYSRHYAARTIYNLGLTPISREDKIKEWGVGWTWYPTPALQFGLRASWKKQDSNIDFYRYDQRLIQFSTNAYF